MGGEDMAVDELVVADDVAEVERVFQWAEWPDG